LETNLETRSAIFCSHGDINSDCRIAVIGLAAMKFEDGGIFWGEYYRYAIHDQEGYGNDNDPHYSFYFYWKPNYLEKKYRHLGIQKFYHDAIIHVAFGFWWFNLSWSTQWTTDKGV
jgi:hypothetical protein